MMETCSSCINDQGCDYHHIRCDNGSGYKAKTPESQSNQCDGCNRGLEIRDGLHIDENGKPFVVCTSGRYRDEKSPEIDPWYGDVTDASTTKPSALDAQCGGDHYRKHGEYQPWKVLKHWLTPEELRGFAKGTAIVYLAREGDKGGDQDIEKAIHTMQLYMEIKEQK